MGVGGGGWGINEKSQNFVYQPILMKFDIRWFHALLKPNLNSFFKNSEKGGPLRGGGEFTKFFQIFVYRPILIKFDSKWFLGRLKLNFKPIFGNSEKGALGRGDSPKFSKILFINRFRIK